MNVVYPPGHVGGTGHCQQFGFPFILAEFGLQVVYAQAPQFVHINVHHLGVAPPGQVVGVVFHAANQYHIPFFKRKAKGQFVDGFGGVFYKNHGVVFCQVQAKKVCYNFPGEVVQFGTNLGFKTGAAVNAAVPGHQLIDFIQYGLQGGCAGGIVKIDVRNQRAII